MKTKIVTGSLLVGLCLALVGCGGRGGPGAAATQNDLKELGMAYHDFHDAKLRGPRDAEEFKPFVEAKNKSTYEKLKEGTYVFIWNVGLKDMDPTSGHVLAYHKEVPEKGGYVLFGDASVRNLSADEFKNAKLAKPKE